MTFTCTPAQFASLEEQIKASGKATLVEKDQTSGTLTAQGVVITYVYDGTANLVATVTARHGLAAIDSMSDVVDRVTKMFNQFIQGAPQ